MNSFKQFFAGLLLTLCILPCTAQPVERFNTYTQLLSPEKIYLHTDREVYCVGDTVWFRAYLGNAAAASEYPTCNYAYVELLSSLVEKDYNRGRNVESESVRVRVKVKRMNDILSGWIKIPDNLNTGVATLRAYSYWMLNREPEYMFYKNIEIRNPMKDDFVDILIKDEVKDNEKYAEMGVVNPFAKQRETKREADIQFLPESGRWRYGEPATLGIRAVGEDGMGIPVSGEIYADDQTAARFETDARGLGTVTLTLQAPVKRLYAQVYDGEEFLARADLPRPSETAATIRMQLHEDSVDAEISAGGVRLPDSTFVLVHDTDDIYLRIPYSEQSRRMKIPLELLSPGINNLALVDARGLVYAERAFFVFPESVRPELTLDKDVYGPRERVSAEVALPEGSYSVAVSDDGYAPISGRGYDLISWWYLGSELPTFVENAASYFDETRPLAERIAAMDKVMLTHGWKYYELPKILSGETMMPYFGREYAQSLSGVVKGTLRTARRSIVSFVAPSIGFSAMGELDTTGYFALNGLDFPEETQFLVGAVSLGGSTRRFTPFLNDDIFAVYHHYPSYLGKVDYSQQYKQDMLRNYYNAGGEIVYSLHPSFISVSRPAGAVNISPFPDYEFKQGQFRSEQELTPYNALDLMTYIVTTCPPLRFADNVAQPISSNANTVSSSDDGGGEEATDVPDAVMLGYRPIVCRTQKVSSQMGVSSGWEEILVFVNGMKSSCAELDGLMVSDITAFAYITGADAVRFNTDAGNMLAPRSVVMVKTRTYARDVAANVSTGKPLGWQQPHHFYSPRYEDPQSRKAPEAVRATLYWNPGLVTEPGQNTRFDFYTSDHKADCTVVIEGFTKDGIPVSIKGSVRR